VCCRQLQHLTGVLALVGLGAQGHTAGPRGVSKRASVGPSAIGETGPINTPEGIHLMHELALGRSAHRWVCRAARRFRSIGG